MEHELIQELNSEYEKARKKYKIKASLEDIQKIVYIKDSVMKEGYVSSEIVSNIVRKMVDNLHSWAGYLHGILFPNPQNMLSMTESQFFSEDEKKQLYPLMSEVMSLSSKHSLYSLEGNPQSEAKLIDEAVSFWNKTFNPKLKELMTKVSKSWNDKKKEK